MKIKDIDNYRKDDVVMKQRWDDTRKPKLTIRHLNKLRKMKELKNLEAIQQAEQLETIFSEPGSDEATF